MGDAKYAHWFDGDGAFGRGREETTTFVRGRERRNDDVAPVTVRAGIKFVRTSRFAAQEAPASIKASRFAARGRKPTRRNFPFANLFRFPTNPSNTAPLVHAGELFALCEGGAPVRDRQTHAGHAGRPVSGFRGNKKRL